MFIKPLQHCDPNGQQKSVMINLSTASGFDIDSARRCAIANSIHIVTAVLLAKESGNAKHTMAVLESQIYRQGV